MQATLKVTTDYFTLYELAEGVYAAIVQAGAGAWGNAGIVDLGDRALVFDTFAKPAAARVLRETAESITGQPVAYALNSHRHIDHVGGNIVFRDVPIATTTRTRDLIKDLTPRFLAYLREQGESYLEEVERQIADAWSEGIRQGNETQRDEIRAICAALPEMELTLPTLTFEEELYFHGTKRTAHFLNCGANHTPSDAVLWVPDDSVLFAGDIVQVRTHPSMGQGDHAHWVETMERLAALAPEWVVPGHGEVGSGEDITLMKQYVQEVGAGVSVGGAGDGVTGTVVAVGKTTADGSAAAGVLGIPLASIVGVTGEASGSIALSPVGAPPCAALRNAVTKISATAAPTATSERVSSHWRALSR